MFTKPFASFTKTLTIGTLFVSLFSINHAYAATDSQNQAVVNTDFLTLRSAPTQASQPLDYLPKNTKVTVLEESANGWEKVSHSGKIGYVYGAYTTPEAQPAWEKKVDGIINLGESYWGTPYVYGAERFQDKTFDCSSFVQYLYSKYGVSLGWNAREQAKQGEWIPIDSMQKGDLMFFADEAFPNEQGLNKVRHVGIYLGNGKILHTYEEGIGVTISDLYHDKVEGDYWYRYFLFAKRVIPHA